MRLISLIDTSSERFDLQQLRLTCAAQTKCGMHIIRIVIIKVGFKGAERKCRVLRYDYLIDEI